MSAKKKAETAKPSGSDAPICSPSTDRETYRQECRKRWDGEALRDAVANWKHWKSINQELREAMRQFRRNPCMTDLNGTDHANGTLADYLWKLQSAMQPDPRRLDPLIDFCDHYQKCHLRRGLLIYCSMLLKSFEANAKCAGDPASYPSSDADFIAQAKKWCEDISTLSDGEIVCKLADILKENHALKTKLATAHKALTVCDGAMMGKVKPSSVAFKMIRAIMYPENAPRLGDPASYTPMHNKTPSHAQEA